MNQDKNTWDDLTQIKGIGDVREKILQETFNIRQYQDLAQLTVEEVYTLLKDNGESISTQQVAEWIEEAGRFTRRKSSDHDFDPEVFVKATNKDKEWSPFATFIVDFQKHHPKSGKERFRTTIHHMQTDSGANWSGVELEEHCQWIYERVDVESDTIPVKKMSYFLVKIDDLAITQQGEEKPVSLVGRLTATAHKDQTFSLDIKFSAFGERLDEEKDKVGEFHLNCIAQDLELEDSHPLGEPVIVPMEQGKKQYQARFENLTLSTGKHRLWITVKLNINSAVPDFIEVPLLEVA